MRRLIVIDKLADGYYISAYCDIDDLGNILSTSVRHDHNIALWRVTGKHVELLHHCEIERISGYKHHRIPFFCIDDFYIFINNMVKRFGIREKDIIGYIGVKGAERNIKMPLHDTIAFHSLCHLYSSIGMNSENYHNKKILGLSIDGEPDTMYETSARDKFYYAGTYINGLQNEVFPINSPGALWTACVEEINLQEGTLMALATASLSESLLSYNRPTRICDKKSSLECQIYVRKLIKDIMAYTDSDIGTKFSFFDERFTEHENKISMIMKVVQDWSIQIIDDCIDELIERYQIAVKDTYIALSGGYALNCPTNTHIMHKYGFKGQMIVPSVNDGGQAIGLGLICFYSIIPDITFHYPSAYLGNAWNVYDESYSCYIENVSDGLENFVSDISRSPIIWYNSNAESGPRALGNRSILADPRTLESKRILNQLKQREWWRPVAPIVLESEQNDWFENSFPSKYMLNNFSLKRNKKAVVPAILHLDGTCRVQTVGNDNKLLFDVLDKFFVSTGVPILCNTSLNDRDEPIVDTIEQMFNFALRKGIEIAYINGQRYKFKNADQYHIVNPLQRNVEKFEQYSQSYEIRQRVNPYQITANEYFIYMNSSTGYKFNVKEESGAHHLKRIAKILNTFYIKGIGDANA